MSDGSHLIFEKMSIIINDIIIDTKKSFREFSESLELIDKWTDITIQPHEIKEESEPNAN